MLNMLKEVDRIVRGDATHPSALRSGSIEIAIGKIALAVLVLGAIYGVCMGSFAALRVNGELRQVVATTIKVPALFFLTLLITFPSLYVFNALVGSKLNFAALLKLLFAALGLTVAVLASLGPIVVLFSASTTNYSFMVLMNVVAFALAGILGLAFLLQTLHRLSLVESAQADDQVFEAAAEAETEDSSAGKPSVGKGALDAIEGYVLGPHVKTVFRVWVVVFGLVGAQLSWVMRPFVGYPGQEFSWFRARESNFFEGLWQAISTLLRG
jgi:hypothetical protein